MALMLNDVPVNTKEPIATCSCCVIKI